MMTWAALLANSLVAAVWQGMLLTLLAGLALRLLPGVSAAVRSALWSAVFVLAIALHFVPAAGFSAAPVRAAYHVGAGWSVALLAIWALLSAFRAGQLLVGALHLRGLARRATPVPATMAAGRFRRPAILCTSPEVDRPSVIGFFAPRILIPPGLYAAVTPAELEPILLHEAGHLRRGDDWTNLLQKLALVVFPLNPVLLWVERRLCRERELACDDLVLAATHAPKAYALCLTSLAEHAVLRRTLSLALGAWQRQPELSARVHRILHRPAQTLTRLQTAAVAVAVLLGLGAGADVLAGSPQLVAFGRVAPMQMADVSSGPPASSGKGLLVKATMPEAREAGARPVLLKSVIRSRHTRPARRLQRAGVASPEMRFSQQPRMILTVTRAVSRAQVSNGSTPTFVPIAAYAVRTPDGWLILQL